MELIEVNNLSFSYGDKQILSDLSFQIDKGEILGIIGPNGSGKTTLLSVISGFFTDIKGEVLFQGKNIKEYKKIELARSFAFLEQEGTPHLSFTVEEIVSMGTYPWQKQLVKDSRGYLDIIDGALRTLEMENLRSMPLYKLSGGERQLVALARAMVQQPQIIFLDEPTNYLDIRHQLLFMKHIKNWQKEKQLTAIMVLHDLNLAAQYCDRLVLLNKGKIEAIGAIEEVIKESYISKVYNTEAIVIEHPIYKKPQILI